MRSQGNRIGASHKRNAIKRDILIVRNQIRSLRHGLRHEQMIERIAVMKWKSSESDKMRVRDIQPVETLIRQNRNNLFDIGIKFADAQLHSDFPKGDSTDEDIILGIANKATRMVP
ncbi:hypothetical protein EV130_11357 [Rhizobium azibense]|uniref:Uncharacterized protein n=2 Tax=Rhizobium TaxID=379 RepID=A0A4V6P0X0_9HYPH|nr:hypothetical conserved protein [Rhizobium etli CFN 42]KKZ84681.1 hypothetical protein RPHASCH2410_PC01815 [Rhizobium phaseoli Ch24-10]TCU19635.1 hypothetical protein EV130_11357 [Rhizobium azibense]